MKIHGAHVAHLGLEGKIHIPIPRVPPVLKDTHDPPVYHLELEGKISILIPSEPHVSHGFYHLK